MGQALPPRGVSRKTRVQFRRRAGPPPDLAGRVELWGEGFRFYDLKRLNEPLDRTGANHNASLVGVTNVPAGDIRWQFLIPQAELNNTNGVVVQNPL